MRRELLLLREMRDAAVAIRDLVGGRSAEESAEEVDADALRRSALLWHFMVVGEAASQIPSDEGRPPSDRVARGRPSTQPNRARLLGYRCRDLGRDCCR